MQSIKEGLSQIPVKHLRDNLLPLLEEDDRRLLYNGSIAYRDCFGPMVGALPEAVRVNARGFKTLTEQWNLILKKDVFNADPPFYCQELEQYGRAGCLAAVHGLIAESEVREAGLQGRR